MRSNTLVALEKKIDEYIESLTIHGLTRTVKGKRVESIFWMAILLIGLLTISIVMFVLIRKYNTHAVYIELKSKNTEKNHFPSVTICEETLLRQAYFSYCGTPMQRRNDITNTSKYCVHPLPYRKATNIAEPFWGTYLFNITSCTSLSTTTPCNNNKYFTSKSRVNNSCITWNYNGDYYDTHAQVHIEFEFHKPVHQKSVEMFIIPHDHKVLEIDITKKIEIDPGYKYEILIDKTLIKRLPAPYPSNCTEEEEHNIFPGKYTRFSCIESHYYVEMYKKCGDVFDYHRPYIPKTIFDQFQRNSTEVKSCIEAYAQRELRNPKHCQFACQVLDLEYQSSIQTPTDEDSRKRSLSPRSHRYEIAVRLKAGNEYRVMEEKALYTLSQIACEIGGFVGVIMGMSVISVIELMVVIALSICKRILNNV